MHCSAQTTIFPSADSALLTGVVRCLNSPDVKEVTPLHNDFDPLKELLVDQDPVQLQDPFGAEIKQKGHILESSIDVKIERVSLLEISDRTQRREVELKENGSGNDGNISFGKSGLEALNSYQPLPTIGESYGPHYGGAELDLKGQFLVSSIDVKMEKVGSIEISDRLQEGDVGMKENRSGNVGDINCWKPGLETLKGDQTLSNKEVTCEGKSDDEEGSMSIVGESNCGDSSSDESSSDESRSIIGSMSSSEDEDYVGMKRKEEEGGEFEEGEMREVDASEVDFLSDEEGGPKGPIRSKHEVEDLPPVPKVDLSLQPNHKLLPVGSILSVMNNRVIVEGSVRHSPLNEGSILWATDTRSPLGLVDEIFGPVKNPYYVVRYNTEEEVPVGVKVGMPVSFVVEFASQILNDKDLYKKGYDASGDNDEEVDGDFEFSDDEKEAEYRKLLRQGKRVSNDRIEMTSETRIRRKRSAFMKSIIQYKCMQKQQICAPLSMDQPHPKNLVRAFTNPIIQNKGMQKQQICAPLSMDQPHPKNLVPSQPAAFVGHSGIGSESWNSSGPTNTNLPAPSKNPEFSQSMQAVNFLSNSSQQLNENLIASSRIPNFPQAMQAVNFLGNSSQQLPTPHQEAPQLPGFSPHIQNTGFQSDLTMQLQNQNLFLNNLVNMMAYQQQLQQLIPHQGSNFPWFGAASSSLQHLGQNNFAPLPFIRAPGPQGPGNSQTQGQAPLPFAPSPAITGPQCPGNEQIRSLAPSPFPPSPFISAQGPQGPGNEQIQGQAPSLFAPSMQFTVGNSSSSTFNAGNSRPHGKPFQRGGGRFFGGGGRNPNR